MNNRFDLYRAIRSLSIPEQQSLFALLKEDLAGAHVTSETPKVAIIPVKKKPVGKPSNGIGAAIIELMESNEGSATRQQMLTYIHSKFPEAPEYKTQNALNYMKAKGLVENTSQGVWSMVTSGIAAA